MSVNSQQHMFKVPESIPQDLLLIHDLIGEIPAQPTTRNRSNGPPVVHTEVDDDDEINSSGNEGDSEDEVEADLDVKIEDDDCVSPKAIGPSDSSSDSGSESDSDSDSGHSEIRNTVSRTKLLIEECDDEDSGPYATTETSFQTKNELIDTEISVPGVEEVGPDEVLEKVGEIMSVVGNVVIVKGFTVGTSERALDSDTLLVFEDRKVLGYIYETFGPTFQPLYQVKFNQKFPLDTEKVQVSRQVFHLPDHSNFVFLSQLKKWKGSDASNVHDEEPADDELEFSDDEEEAAFKSQRKRKRGEFHANSEASSRHSTPTPSQMHDQDLIDDFSLGASVYNDRGYNDYDFSSAGPSRPAPIPYDDPYSNEYDAGALDGATLEGVVVQSDAIDGPSEIDNRMTRRRGRGRGMGGHHRGDMRRDSGGRGRGRGWVDRGRGRGRYNGHQSASRQPVAQLDEPYDPRMPRPLSPTSLAIARATGQLSDGSTFASENELIPHTAPMSHLPNTWQFQQSQMQAQHHLSFGAQQQFVQPHINPRFAAQFGIDLGFMQPQFYPQYGHGSFGLNNTAGGLSDRDWADQWTVHGGDTCGSSTDRNDTGPGHQPDGNS